MFKLKILKLNWNQSHWNVSVSTLFASTSPTTLVIVEAFRIKSSVQFKVVTYANYIISSFIVNTANFADLLERSYEYISLLNVISDSIFFIAQIHCCLTLDAKGFIWEHTISLSKSAY